MARACCNENATLTLTVHCIMKTSNLDLYYIQLILKLYFFSLLLADAVLKSGAAVLCANWCGINFQYMLAAIPSLVKQWLATG